MTRLLAEDVSYPGLDWPRLEDDLRALTGLSLLALAAEAAGRALGPPPGPLAGKTVAAVPDTSGQGLIPGFSEALALIARRLGADSLITAPDAQGFDQAKAMGADLVLTSSDDDYVCLNLKTGARAENGQSTGLGFAQALFRMAGGRLSGQKALVIGAGPVGASAARRLAALGARVIVFDLLAEKAEAVASHIPLARPWAPDLGAIPSDFHLIVEASTSAAVWPPESVSPGTLIAAPGMPFSFAPSPRYRLWAEPLATGTAVMLLEAALPRV